MPSHGRTKHAVERNLIASPLGALNLIDVTPGRIDEYLQSRSDLAPQTLNHLRSHLLTAFNRAKRCGTWLRANPVEGVPRRRVPKRLPDFLRADEVPRVLGLDWQYVDLRRRIITVRASAVNGIISSPKNHRERHVPIAADLAELLAAHALPRGLVFPNERGAPMIRGTAVNAIVRARRRAAIPHARWHVLRHTFASDLAGAGVPMRAIQELLGHESLEMTMRYAHLAPSALRNAIDTFETFLDARQVPTFGQLVGNAVAKRPPSHLVRESV